MATIGIDLTPIQGPHRMRGVGSTAINVLRHVSDADKARHQFVFYLHDSGKEEVLDLIDASSFPDYKLRLVAPARPLSPSIKTFRGLRHIPRRIKDSLLDRKLGTRRITELEGIDSFLQFEQDIIPPNANLVRSTLIAYDLIPYVLERDYLWNYETARRRHNYSRRGALKAHARRLVYLRTIRTAMRRAHKIIAISEHTKSDFMKHVGVHSSKITVCHLGISDDESQKRAKPTIIDRYVGTSWGDIKISSKLPDTPFLLFVGGADPRRKLADLVHAFNLLRAQGHDLHLVLAGDTMLGPNSIPNDEARRALLNSSYIDDVYMLGFIDDAAREWLYQGALAFVYPSRYEGFGLPILEAMRYGTPVITYKNSSIEEIGKTFAYYAHDYTDIAAHCRELSTREEARNTLANKRHAASFKWTDTSERIIAALGKL